MHVAESDKARERGWRRDVLRGYDEETYAVAHIKRAWLKALCGWKQRQGHAWNGQRLGQGVKSTKTGCLLLGWRPSLEINWVGGNSRKVAVTLPELPCFSNVLGLVAGSCP